ncbi:hypothetical protein MLD38_029714 [Melastoma candidum]|uniref:Uncharacterized protein n=1 Tax=Melastoma candidum TaxID=119954 RepID=A0ACB9N4S9_9MYRT|nr:hypothetical protein MLD38_029714 [Melastoma candidum]
MDATVGCLVNSISRFIHLVLCQRVKPHHLQNGYKKITEVLKLLKSVLDAVVESRMPPDDTLQKEWEELDVIVNEARELLGRWSLGMSKICGVSRVDSFLIKIQGSSIEICKALRNSLSYGPVIAIFVNIEDCLREIQDVKRERTAECIVEALRNQRQGIHPRNETVLEIAESLNLRLGEELFRETIAVEKERLSNVDTVKGDIDQIARLLTYMRDFMIQTNYFQSEVSKRIPPYFRCPLSSVLMLDPVIVASGQTYERAAIQKWLDQGLSICPKTRLPLTHLNFITNYTVKDMVNSWWDQNNDGHKNSSEVLDLICVDSQVDLVSPRKLEKAHTVDGSARGGGSNLKPSLDSGSRRKGKEGGSSRMSSQEEYKEGDFGEIERFEALLALEESDSDSRSASTCSARSSVDYVSGLSDHIPSLPGSSRRHHDFPYQPLYDQSNGSVTVVKARGSGDYSCSEAESFLSSDPTFDESTTHSYVEKLVGDLKSQSRDLQTKAAAELRLLAKNNPMNRRVIGQCNAIVPLLSLIYSPGKWAQEHAVTTLLNLSLNEENKVAIVEAGAIEPLLYVLKSGGDGARENAAATFFSLSTLDEYKSTIGRSGAIKVLVNLLGTGSPRGKKDAAGALFSLSIFHGNKARMVQAGAVKRLVELIDPVSGMVDKALAILSNLSTISEGCTAIVREGGIPSLVEVVESGSQRGKENAASVLLQLCIGNPKICTLVLQEGVVPPLVALSQSGTPRAKEKARQLLSHFRNQREGAIAKTKR